MQSSSAVIISLLIYHRVIFTEGSFLREKTLSDSENILGNFFAEIKLLLDKHNPQHMTVLGASGDQLDLTKSLLEAYPHFIGRNGNEFCASKEFAPKTLIIYFLASLEEEYVTEVTRSLFDCKKNRIYFMFEGVAVKNVDVESVLRVASEKISKLSVFILYTEKLLKLYGYKMTADCTRRAELLVDWTSGTNNKMKWLDDWDNRYTHEGCPMSVGTMYHPPWMDIADDANGVVRIIGGLEGNIISAIAEKMNFTPVVQNFRISNDDKVNNTEPIVSSCAARNTDIGIAHVRPTESVVKIVDVSQSYAQECIVWCVPRITHWKRNIIVSEFSWSTWVLIGLTFLASFVVEKIVRSTRKLNKGKANKSECCSIILDLIGSTLGNPIVYRPLSIGGKVLLIACISYSLVITTAYKTSLASILMVENHESSIIDLRGIIEANITTGGHPLKLEILQDQIRENKLMPELIKRFVIEKNISKSLRQVSKEKNLAYLTSIIDLIYSKQLFSKDGEPVTFDVLNECVLTHGTVVVFSKSLHFTDRINQVILRLASGGLLDYWMLNNFNRNTFHSESAHPSKIINTQEMLHKFTRDKFYHIFYIYCLALTFCVLIFLGELLVHKLKFADRVQRFNNFQSFKLRRCTTR